MQRIKDGVEDGACFSSSGILYGHSSAQCWRCMRSTYAIYSTESYGTSHLLLQVQYSAEEASPNHAAPRTRAALMKTQQLSGMGENFLLVVNKGRYTVRFGRRELWSYCRSVASRREIES
jgi:hypothetical protein